LAPPPPQKKKNYMDSARNCVFVSNTKAVMFFWALDVWEVLKCLLMYDGFCREQQHCFDDTMGTVEWWWPDVWNWYLYSNMLQSITRRTSSRVLFCSLDHTFSNYDERNTNEMHFQTKPYIEDSYMFRRCRSAIFREPYGSWWNCAYATS
jgi:hypothetical protein